MAQTRGKTCHFTLGQPSELPKNKLPLEIDVFNKFKKIKEENVNRPTKHIAQELSENIVTLWKEKGNLPTVDIRWVQEQVEYIYSRGRELLKIPKVRREKILATGLKLAYRIEVKSQSESFITFKGHKRNFLTQPICQLLNHNKSGTVSRTAGPQKHGGASGRRPFRYAYIYNYIYTSC